MKINEREVKYQTVIRELVKRYIMKRQQKDQTEGVTEDDLNEIKQDISAFRYEIFSKKKHLVHLLCFVTDLNYWKS